MGKIRGRTASVPRGLIRAVAVLIFIFLPFLVTSCSDSDSTTTTPRPPEGDTLSFLKAHYRVSHNSYSGNLDDGYRGSIIQQLDAGLRFVELDIHWEFDNGTVSFILGHSDPRQYVDRTHGNPYSYDAKDWVSKLKDWVQNNQPKEPVILAFDWKTDFNKNHAEDKEAIETLHSYFMDESIYLFPKDFDAENIFAYKGRVMVVLSGNENARNYYLGTHSFSDLKSYAADNSLPVAHMFVEYQDGNDSDLEGQLFYARKFEDGGCGWAEKYTGEHFTRLWLLTSPCEWANTEGGLNGPNLPATNFPYFGWYARYTDDLKVIPDFEFKTIEWHKYDSPRKGSNPDVAVNNLGHVVEVHKSQSEDQLYYSVGSISGDGKSIDWDEEFHDQNYTHGTTPSVAIVDHLNDKGELLLVEIHEDGKQNLYYRFGLISTDNEGKLKGKIIWQGENFIHYDDGNHPSVAINEDKMVVEVHEGSDYDLWYNVGGFDEQGTFSWGNKVSTRNYNTAGKRPTVALHGNLIFEAHYNASFPPSAWTDTLWCQIGSLNAADKKIDWENPDSKNSDKATFPYPIDEIGSLYPSVALYSNGAVEAHKDGDGIWWRMGKTNNSVMAVGPTKRIQSLLFGSDHPPGASGTQISIDASDTHVVLAYISGDSNIYYMVGGLK